MKKEVEFVGISVGTNDITALNNTPNEQEEEDNLKTCQKQAEFLIETASKVSDDYNVDVYIFQQPPRYDKVEEDKLGNWSRYSKLTNSHLAILASNKHRLHLVDNSNLARLPGQSRARLYGTDGVHLSKRGAYTLETNLILTIHERRPDLKTLEVHAKVHPPKVSKHTGYSGRDQGATKHQYQGSWYQQSYNQQYGHQLPYNQQQQYSHQQGPYNNQQQGQYYHQQGQYWGPDYSFPQYYTNQWAGW